MAYAITALVLGLLSVLFAITSKKKAPVDAKGNKILRLSIGYGIIGIFCSLIGLSFIALAFYWIYSGTEASVGSYVILFFIFLFFGGIGIGLVLATWLAKITYNEEKIICKTWLGNTKIIKWTDVKSIEYFLKDLRISDGKVKIICEEHVKGFIDLTEFIEEKIGITRERMGLPKYLIR